ncbi:hypothetical protein [Legionella jamestowniensis]|uniref:Uncharacterized protein n=1 Tax=Legionella jamestowniensis TaxID=455 RepID=A0A0W0UP00_9GAMM|nr:hypothetical protein [Legionella jamestowniensis]KTD09373.1 hypothetical protein Ljam_0723 [Legionella jamestowniensis]OCH99200.1 hypothetical protein A8135_08120 [Legionella jamestowniensis]SFL88291.1 hypothetical protein SAMN02746073_2393 [Legionella jamestowniensis DSM 19215]
MSKKVLFVFAGTGDTANHLEQTYEKEAFDTDVIRIYFNGCQDKAIGGRTPGIGYISPNLDTVARKLRTCFNDDGILSLKALKQEFGKAVVIRGVEKEKKIKVNDISMTGFSRGAVTTFAVARHLDDLDIPMSLFASDPVPGNPKQLTHHRSTSFNKNFNLSHCENLKKATVVLGMYQKNINPLHNKFFRQMAPIFNKHCESAIYTVPKAEHLSWSAFAKNHELDFIHNQELTTELSVYSEEKASFFFTPKVLQQKFHTGVDGRVQLTTRYKEKLFDAISMENGVIRESDPVKMGLALYILDTAPGFDNKTRLYKAIKKNTAAGTALREFLVEFESINQYLLAKNNNIAQPLDNFKIAVHQLLASFPIEKATYAQKENLKKAIFHTLQTTLKDKIPNQSYSTLKNIMQDFLKDNVIFHIDLAKYIDESETFQSGPTPVKDPEHYFVDIAHIKDADELATRLYQMSERSRISSYEKYGPNLPKIIKNEQQLGDIIRFLPPDKIAVTLKNSQIKPLINNIDAINTMMEKLFTAEQRKQVFLSVKEAIPSMELNFAQLGKLMQYLSFDKNKQLLEFVSFDKMKENSPADVIKLLDQLSLQQLTQLLPSMGLHLKKIIAKSDNPAELQDLKTWLSRKIENAPGKKMLDTIFSQQPETNATTTFKARLQTISADPGDKQEKQIKIV